MAEEDDRQPGQDKTRKSRFARARGIDSRLGRAWARFWGAVCVIAGLAILLDTAFMENFSLASHWPPLLFACALIALGIAWMRSKQSLLQQLSEMPERDRAGPGDKP